jgi:hypothetical protein
MVSFVDTAGMRHSIEVTAETLYEAARSADRLVAAEPFSGFGGVCGVEGFASGHQAAFAFLALSAISRPRSP